MTYSVWMKIPATSGWSRVAGELTKGSAEQVAAALFFEARVIPDAEQKEGGKAMEGESDNACGLCGAPMPGDPGKDFCGVQCEEAAVDE